MKTKLINIKKLTVYLLLFLLLTGFSSLQAQMVTVMPTEYANALTNPLMGFRRDINSNWKLNPYSSIQRDYIEWNALESTIADTGNVQKIIDYCNVQWAGCEAANVKIIPRVILEWDETKRYFPSYLTPGDFTSQKTRDAVVRMIKKLGQAWNNDPRVAWVQTGIIGKWGEQESPVGVDENVVAPDNSNWAEIMGQAFEAAFPNKLLVVRNQPYWTAEGYDEMGVYWDSFAHTNQYSGSWTTIKNTNATGRYLIAPVEGEVAYGWGPEGLANFGTSPDATCSTPAYYNFIINTIKQLHCSGLGWIASYNQNSSTAAGANLIQKAFGYRFKISEFTCSARTEPGSTLTMSAKVKNIGSAVMFENWPVAFVLVNESTRQIVYQSVISGTDIRTWAPGSNFDWDPKSNANGSKVYLTPAVDNSISATISIPSNIVSGQYLAGLTILDPTTQKPGVFFAVNNFFKESQSQPLCRIGIGVDVTNNTLTGPFDHPVNNDTRYYSRTPTTTYTLTETSTNGSVSFSPTGGTYASGTVVTVTAIPATGYQFSSWSGNLSGTTNPTTITMNANKSITANFSTLQPDPIPWTEAFTYANGTTSHGAPTKWTATNMSVQNNEISFNNVGADGVFTAGPIDISSGPVNVSLNVRGGSGLDVGQDFLRLYKKVDGGAEVLIDAADGLQPAEIWTGNIATGSSLVLVLRAHVTATTEYYYFDNLNVTASTPPVTYTLTTTATNGTITRNPAGSTYASGTVVNLTATPNSGYTFTGWSGDLSGSTNPATITMNANKSVTANFAAITYTLTETSLNGSVTFNPAGGIYAPGTMVTVTAIPATDYQFNNWSGDLSGSVNPTTITMNANKSVTANFTQITGCVLPWTDPGLTVNANVVNNTFGPINISCAANGATISVTLQGVGADASDYCRVYYKVDGGAQQTLVAKTGAFAIQTFSVSGIVGTSVQIIVQAATSWADEFYYITNLSVADAPPCTDNLPWTKADITVNNLTITNQSQGVVNTSCASTVTITADVEGLGGLDLADYCRMQYKVNGGTTLQPLFDINNLAGAFAKKLFSKTVTATSVELVLNAKNTFADEIYKITNIKITSNGLKSASIATNIEMANAVEEGLRIYPNPTSGILNIDFPNAEISREIKVFNMVGQLIHSVQTKNSSAQIDVQSLNLKGVVIIQVIAAKKISNHRVIVK